MPQHNPSCFEQIADIFALLLVLAGIITILIFAMWGLSLTGINIESPSQLDQYEQIYAECVMQETIESEFCHDIAARQVYGD